MAQVNQGLWSVVGCSNTFRHVTVMRIFFLRGLEVVSWKQCDDIKM